MVEIELLEKMITVIVQKAGKELIVMVTYFCVSVYAWRSGIVISLFFSSVCKTDSVCDSLVPTGQNGTCYRGGITIFENYQMCNVTSKSLYQQILFPLKLLKLTTFTRSKNFGSTQGSNTTSNFLL